MEPERLGQLVDRHAAALGLYARQWCESPEDVVQEAFLKLASLDITLENPEAWLYRAVRNRAIDAGQAERRRKRHEAEAVSRAASWFEPASSEKPGVLDPGFAADALQDLPLDQREVIVARLWGGLTFERIGKVSGLSSSSAHRLYARGIAALRERLGVSCAKTGKNPSEMRSNPPSRD